MKKDRTTKLGALIREIQEARNATNYRMAIDLEVSHTHYAHMRKESANTSIKLLCKLKVLSGMTWTQFGQRLEGIAEIEE